MAEVTGLTLNKTKQGGVDGILVSGFIPFDGDEGFNDEKEGAKYSIPLTARGNNGDISTALSETGRRKFEANKALAKDAKTYARLSWSAGDFAENYTEFPLIKDGMKQMYVTDRGTLTTDPYNDPDNKKSVKSFICLLPKQATANRTYGVRLTPDWTWPDGRVRKLIIDIKANNPMTPEEAKEAKAQATQKRQATSVQAIVERDAATLVKPLVTRMLSEKKPLATIRTLITGMFGEGEEILNALPEDVRNAA